MANDIDEAISANEIKNGTAVVGCLVTGFSDKFTNNTSVSNKPTIADIQDKYDARFDDISYYTLGNSTIVGG
jgi:hypothetical protein